MLLARICSSIAHLQHTEDIRRSESYYYCSVAFHILHAEVGSKNALIAVEERLQEDLTDFEGTSWRDLHSSSTIRWVVSSIAVVAADDVDSLNSESSPMLCSAGDDSKEII